mmetsp:Transcript_165141/g.292444  ORF Transcript_165141/g.292444 Transcript_165141/m.292444 type:complete len:356 (-) Transcript_165141:21-1088(-)
MARRCLDQGLGPEVCWEVHEELAEYVWTPAAGQGRLPGAEDVLHILQATNPRCRRVTLSAGTLPAARSLLFSIFAACRVAPFREEEATSAVYGLVAEALTARFREHVVGCSTKVSSDNVGLLSLEFSDGIPGFRGAPPLADSAPMYRVLAHEVAAHATEAMAGGVLPAFSPSRKLRLRSPTAAARRLASRVICARRRCLLEPKFQQVALTEEVPLSEGEEEETDAASDNDEEMSGDSRTITWSMLQASSIKVTDGLKNLEWEQGLTDVARSANNRYSRALQDLSGEVQVLLGDGSPETACPVLAALHIATLAALTDVLAAGSAIGNDGWVMKEVEVRGCRGCAVSFVLDTPCQVL